MTMNNKKLIFVLSICIIVSFEFCVIYDLINIITFMLIINFTGISTLFAYSIIFYDKVLLIILSLSAVVLMCPFIIELYNLNLVSVSYLMIFIAIVSFMLLVNIYTLLNSKWEDTDSEINNV